MPNDLEIEDRRKFLISCGRFAAVTPPAMTLLLSTSLTSTAIAWSGSQYGSDSRPERSFFDNDPDQPGENKAADDQSSRADKTSQENGNHASLGGGGSGGGGGDGGGGGARSESSEAEALAAAVRAQRHAMVVVKTITGGVRGPDQ